MSPFFISTCTLANLTASSLCLLHAVTATVSSFVSMEISCLADIVLQQKFTTSYNLLTPSSLMMLSVGCDIYPI